MAVQPLQLPLPHSSSSSTLDSDSILSDPATPRTKANPLDTAIELSDPPIGNPNSLNSDTGSPGFVEPPRTDAVNLQIDPPVISIPQNSAMDSIASNLPCYPPSIDTIESLKTKVLELETTIQKMSDSYKGDLAIMQSQILSLQECLENIKKSQPTKRRSDTRPSFGTKNMHKQKNTVRSQPENSTNATSHSSKNITSDTGAFKIVWGTKRSVTNKVIRECLDSAQDLDPKSLSITFSNRSQGNWWFTIAGSSQDIASLSSQWLAIRADSNWVLLDSLKSRPRTLHPASASAETALPYRIVCGMPSQTTEDDITSSLTAIEDYNPSVVKVKLSQSKHNSLRWFTIIGSKPFISFLDSHWNTIRKDASWSLLKHLKDRKPASGGSEHPSHRSTQTTASCTASSQANLPTLSMSTSHQAVTTSSSYSAVPQMATSSSGCTDSGSAMASVHTHFSGSNRPSHASNSVAHPFLGQTLPPPLPPLSLQRENLPMLSPYLPFMIPHQTPQPTQSHHPQHFLQPALPYKQGQGLSQSQT